MGRVAAGHPKDWLHCKSLLAFTRKVCPGTKKKKKKPCKVKYKTTQTDINKYKTLKPHNGMEL